MGTGYPPWVRAAKVQFRIQGSNLEEKEGGMKDDERGEGAEMGDNGRGEEENDGG